MTFEERIRAIVHNRTKGSSGLVDDICAAFTSVSQDQHEALQWAFQQLRGMDSSMVVVQHCLDALEPRLGDHFTDALIEYEARWREVHQSVARNLMRHFDFNNCSVLAHSHSSLVVKVARIVDQTVRDLTFQQTRSEPDGEGVLQYEELQRAGIDAELVEDNRIASIVTKVDAVWLGVDQFSETAFVNKVGSGAIVDACMCCGTPVFVLGDTRKHVTSLNFTSNLFERVPFLSGVQLVVEELK